MITRIRKLTLAGVVDHRLGDLLLHLLIILGDDDVVAVVTRGDDVEFLAVGVDADADGDYGDVGGLVDDVGADGGAAGRGGATVREHHRDLRNALNTRANPNIKHTICFICIDRCYLKIAVLWKDKLKGTLLFRNQMPVIFVLCRM